MRDMDGEVRWEVSLQRDLVSRYVVGMASRRELGALIARAFTMEQPFSISTAAVAVTRLDCTPEKMAEARSTKFYSVYVRKDGVVVHRRRVPISPVEKEWIRVLKDLKPELTRQKRASLAALVERTRQEKYDYARERAMKTWNGPAGFLTSGTESQEHDEPHP